MAALQQNVAMTTSDAAPPAVVMPPPPYRRQPGESLVPTYTLTEEEQATLDQFRRNLSDLQLPEHQAFCSDACLVRYLRARNFQLPKSEALLRETLKWRSEEARFDKLDVDGIMTEYASGKLYAHGFDRRGRPVQYQKPRRQNTKPNANQIWQVAYTLEREASAMDLSLGVEQHVLVVDFKGYSLFNAPSMSTTKAVMNILLNQYPERLGDAFMVDAPGLFHVAYRAISPFIPAQTKAKIHFVKRSGKGGRNGKMDPVSCGEPKWLAELGDSSRTKARRQTDRHTCTCARTRTRAPALCTCTLALLDLWTCNANVWGFRGMGFSRSIVRPFPR
eukprot:m.306378 g.306378  ORF g.306378 m.306378 type:complete len:333 (-) comp19621_c0_seq15:1705-2703(-)